MRKSNQKGAATGRGRRSGAKDMLASEIELIIRERERLLQTAGAAAALFTKLNIRDLPNEAREPIRRLGAVLGALSEETLTDAIEHVLGRSRRLAGAAR